MLCHVKVSLSPNSYFGFLTSQLSAETWQKTPLWPKVPIYLSIITSVLSVSISPAYSPRDTKRYHLTYSSSDSRSSFCEDVNYFEQASKALQHLEGYFLLRPTALTADFTMATLLQANCQAGGKCLGRENLQQPFFIKLRY